MLKVTGRVMSVALVLVAAAGCGSTASIRLKDATDRNGKIVAADDDNIYLENDEGRTLTVPRSQIWDLDHPGNVAATIGALLVGYGIFNIAVAAPKCEKEGAAFCTGVFAPAALGLGLAVYGVEVWRSSVNAMSTDRHGRKLGLGSLLLTPTFAFADGKPSQGLAILSRF